MDSFVINEIRNHNTMLILLSAPVYALFYIHKADKCKNCYEQLICSWKVIYTFDYITIILAPFLHEYHEASFFQL
jgi:hypothetical protein